MKNITLSAEESLIEAARAHARAEQTTLNEPFRRRPAGYAQTRERMGQYDALMPDRRGKMKAGRKLGRQAIQ